MKESKTRVMESYVPEKELVEFAIGFSDNYKIIDSGEYESSNNKYKISYVSQLLDEFGRNNPEIGSINDKTGTIRLDKTKLSSESYTSDFVFYMIIWFSFLHEEQKNTDANKWVESDNVDEMAVKYYLTTGRSKANLSIEFWKSIQHNPSAHNVERSEKIAFLLGENESK